MGDTSTSQRQIRDWIGHAYTLMNKEPETCVRLSRKALERSRETGYVIGEGMALMHLGLGHFHQGDYRDAHKYYLQAEKVFRKQSYWYGIRCLYNNLGVLHRQRNELDKALKYYHKNLELESKFPDPKFTVNILINLSSIHLDLKELGLAKEYAEDALACAKEHGLENAGATSCMNLAVCHRRNGSFRKAHSFYERVLEGYQRCGNKDGMAQCLKNQASLFLDEGDHEAALTSLNQALELARELHDRHNQAWIHRSLAQVYRAQNRLDDMRESLETCLEIATAESWQEIIIHALAMFIELAEIEEDWKSALELTRRRQKAIDTLNDRTRNRDIDEIRTKLLVQKREHEAEILRLKTDELTRRVEEEVKKRERQQRIILQKSRMESLGRLAAGIAHEINQPLGMLNIGIQNLFHKIEQGTVPEQYLARKQDTINGHIQRIKKIIEHIRLFSRDRSPGTSKLFDVRDVIRSALSMIGVQYREHNIRIETRIADQPLRTTGDPFRLEQVILNLLTNARDALDEKYDRYDDRKEIRIKAQPGNGTLLLEVADNGCGIDPEHLPMIFDPFFTTKDEIRGTGLGLTICFGIITDMGGSIHCDSVPGTGTTFHATLPLLKSSE